jgi:hypothetical protein
VDIKDAGALEKAEGQGKTGNGFAPSEQSSAAASDNVPFWTRQWYAVAVEAETSKEKAHAIRILGGTS